MIDYFCDESMMDMTTTTTTTLLRDLFPAMDRRRFWLGFRLGWAWAVFSAFREEDRACRGREGTGGCLFEFCVVHLHLYCSYLFSLSFSCSLCWLAVIADVVLALLQSWVVGWLASGLVWSGCGVFVGF